MAAFRDLYRPRSILGISNGILKTLHQLHYGPADTDRNRGALPLCLFVEAAEVLYEQIGRDCVRFHVYLSGPQRIRSLLPPDCDEAGQCSNRWNVVPGTVLHMVLHA